MNVGLIGVGRCGLPIALNLEQKGFKVIASSNDEQYIQNLKNKKTNTTEPYVHDLLQKSKIIFTTDNQKVIDESEIIYIIVPTPSLPTGNYDMQFIDSVIDDLKAYNNSGKNKLCIIASTTNPGYCETVSKSIKAFNCDLFYCPIFIGQGNIFDEFENQDYIMIGCENYSAFEKAKKFYMKIMSNEDKIFNISFTAAEILKISINCFLTLKISFANTIGQLLYKSNCWKDQKNFYNIMKSSPFIGNKFVDFGFGFGGPCLPRDNRSLVEYANKIDNNYDLGKLVDKINSNHLDFLYEFYLNNNNKNLPFYFSYISYRYGTNLDEPAQQFDLAEMFCKNKYKVYVEPSEFLNEKVYQRLKTKFPNYIEKQSIADLNKNNINYYKVN